MKKYIPIILLFVALFGCKQSFESNLDDDPIINKIFSSEEIEDLGKILTFFERQICSIDNMDQTRLSNCYISYFQRIEAAVKAEGIVINISFEEQKKLYKQINKSTFDEIWTFCKCRNSTSGDILKCICFKNGSKYANFLSELERKNPVIHDYYASFKESGDVIPSMVVEIIYNYGSYDINQANIRLLIAIHYLTLNDDYSRNEKYE